MASSDNEVPAPIIIKKIKKGGGGHHGGAWKVAYADFVTAMMAFFLLLWLLNVTTDEQKNAISNYFDPTHPKISESMSGAGGILGGLSSAPDGAMVTNVQPITNPPAPDTVAQGDTLGEMKDRRGEAETDVNDQPENGELTTPPSLLVQTENGSQLAEGRNILEDAATVAEFEEEQLRAELEKRENEQFESVKQQIMAEIEKMPELADMQDQLLIDITPEGLRIQIVDKEGRSMFPVGGSAMHDFMRDLLVKVTQIVVLQPNQISLRGHTDSTPYAQGANYNNWNLSADRALASRQVMVNNGLAQERVENVVGRADREHLVPEEPQSPRNRRISIVLLRQNMDKAVQEALKQKTQAATSGDAQITPPVIDTTPREDREDIPELDRTVREPAPFTIENNGQPVPSVRQRPSEDTNAPQSQNTAPRPLSSPPSRSSSEPRRQVLEFP